jgi:putative membrane protein
MLIAAQIFAALAAVLHVLFFVLESVLWSRPAVYRRFGIASQKDADTIELMAYNQGFYNLALAIGVLVGVVLAGLDGDQIVIGKTLMIFGTGCMAVAGAVLASAGASKFRAAAIQFVPAALALVLTAVS